MFLCLKDQVHLGLWRRGLEAAVHLRAAKLSEVATLVKVHKEAAAAWMETPV